MIIRLSPDAPPTLTDLDRLDRLHAESPGPLTAMTPGPLCRFDDDGEHVWLDIAAARAAGADQSGDDGWTAGYDGMIAYATSKGWTDGTHVRAHVERSDAAS